MLVHSFITIIAEKYGVEGAIIIHNLAFWIKKNQANNENLHEGYFWTYNTAKAFAELFPYWNEQKIYRILNALEENGAIKKGSFNKKKFDRTKWYTLIDKEILDIYELEFSESENGIFNSEKWNFQNRKMEFSNKKNGTFEIEKPIPDINTDIKPDINTDDDSAKNDLAAKRKKKKKRTDPNFAPFRKLFEDYYRRVSDTDYYWQAKDSVALNRIINKVRYAYKTATNPILEPTGEQMTGAFEIILKRAMNDQWLRKNFEVAIIDSKFNNLKANKNGETSKEAFGNVLQGIVREYGIQPGDLA